MRKEDYQSNSGLPVDIVFVPEALHIDFKEKIKLQIAFYRSRYPLRQIIKFVRVVLLNS